MRVTFFGSSLTSAYWNGAATYYRGICRALHRLDHQPVFVEQDIYERQSHRDLGRRPRLRRGGDLPRPGRPGKGVGEGPRFRPGRQVQRRRPVRRLPGPSRSGGQDAAQPCGLLGRRCPPYPGSRLRRSRGRISAAGTSVRRDPDLRWRPASGGRVSNPGSPQGGVGLQRPRPRRPPSGPPGSGLLLRPALRREPASRPGGTGSGLRSSERQRCALPTASCWAARGGETCLCPPTCATWATCPRRCTTA